MDSLNSLPCNDIIKMLGLVKVLEKRTLISPTAKEYWAEFMQTVINSAGGWYLMVGGYENIANSWDVNGREALLTYIGILEDIDETYRNKQAIATLKLARREMDNFTELVKKYKKGDIVAGLTLILLMVTWQEVIDEIDEDDYD